jgi:hypothetical protein
MCCELYRSMLFLAHTSCYSLHIQCPDPSHCVDEPRRLAPAYVKKGVCKRCSGRRRLCDTGDRRLPADQSRRGAPRTTGGGLRGIGPRRCRYLGRGRRADTVMSRGGMKGRPRTHCSSRAIRVIRAAATRAPAAHGPMSRSCRYGLVGATGSSLFGMEGTWNLPFQRLEWKGLGMQGLGT